MSRFTTHVTQLYPTSNDKISEIDKIIDDELEKDVVDVERVNKLKLAKKYAAMEMTSIYGRDPRTMFPW